jgi:hypothetical protein
VGLIANDEVLAAVGQKRAPEKFVRLAVFVAASGVTD